MISEISRSEPKEVNETKVENFSDAKAKSEMTFNEAEDFWKSEFHDEAEQAKVGDTPSVEKTDSQEANAREKIECRNENLAEKEHPDTGVPFVKKIVEVDGVEKEVVVPIFDSDFDAQLPDDMLTSTDAEQKKECNQQLKEAVENDPELREKFNDEQLEQINNGDTPDGYIWHHDAEVGKMQLVDYETHQKTGHTGGRSIWGGGSDNR